MNSPKKTKALIHQISWKGLHTTCTLTEAVQIHFGDFLCTWMHVCERETSTLTHSQSLSSTQATWAKIGPRIRRMEALRACFLSEKAWREKACLWTHSPAPPWYSCCSDLGGQPELGMSLRGRAAHHSCCQKRSSRQMWLTTVVLHCPLHRLTCTETRSECVNVNCIHPCMLSHQVVGDHWRIRLANICIWAHTNVCVCVRALI